MITAYLHGGVRKNSNGSFTVFGTYYDYQVGSDVLYHRTFFDYDIEEARKIARQDIKEVQQQSQQNR